MFDLAIDSKREFLVVPRNPEPGFAGPNVKGDTAKIDIADRVWQRLTVATSSVPPESTELPEKPRVLICFV
jgi:hypothetical protein